MARLPYVDPQADPDAAALLREIAGSRGSVSNVLRSMARAPEGLRRLAQVGDWSRYHTRLGSRLRELAILAIGRELPYVWGHHVPLGLQAGLPQSAIDAIRQGRVPGELPAREKAAVRYVLELTVPESVSDATFKELEAHMDAGEITDLSIMSIYYLALGTLCRAWQIELDTPEMIQGALAWQKNKDGKQG
jgi:4-carboxymuconolactone decarboxylase